MNGFVGVVAVFKVDFGIVDDDAVLTRVPGGRVGMPSRLPSQPPGSSGALDIAVAVVIAHPLSDLAVIAQPVAEFKGARIHRLRTREVG